MTLPVIRPSSLPGYADCARRGATKLFHKEITDAGFMLRQLSPGIGAATGTATHAAAAFTLQEKMLSGNLGNETEAEHRALESLKAETANGVTYDATSPDLNTAEKQVLRQAKAHRLYVAPKLEPVAVEQRYEAETNGFLLSGQIDVAAQGLRDLKTGNKPRANFSQYGSYSLLLRTNNIEVPTITEDFIQRVTISKPQPQPVEILYDVALCETTTMAIIGKIEKDYREFMQTGNPDAFMANPSSVLCSEKYCGAFNTKFCPFGKKT